MLRVICGLLMTIILAGCASSYKPVAPNLLVYDVKENNESQVNFGYRYEVLSYRGNRKYAKRESKKMIRVVAMKIENRSDRSLILGENYNIYAGENQVYPMDPVSVHKELKQGVAIYLLYSLIWLTQGDCDETTGECETKVVFPIGIPISIGNMVFAGSANTQFKNELMRYNLTTREIRPGETTYALIGLPDTSFQPLKLVVKDNR